MRKWEVAPKTFAATELNADELHRKASKSNTKSRRSQGSQNGEPQSAMIRGSKASINRNFNKSPSGEVMSERKWTSPHKQSIG